MLGSQDITGTTYFQIPQRYLEAAAQFTELFNCAEPLFGFLTHAVRISVQQIGISLAVGTAHSPPQLIQLRQPESVRIIHYQRVGVRHVKTVFDDGRAHQHIKLFAIERQHHLLKRALFHLTMGHSHPCFRYQPLQLRCGMADRLDAVVHIVYLSATGQLATHRLSDQGVILLPHEGSYCTSPLRRVVYQRYLADARQRHVQRPRDGGCSQSEAVH